MATRDDAQLMIGLMQWGTSMGIQEAAPVLFADDFDPDSADAHGDRPVNVMLTFGESVGTFVKLGLLDPELVHELLWVQGAWERVGPAALRAREKFGEPRLYENFEALAADA